VQTLPQRALKTSSFFNFGFMDYLGMSWVEVTTSEPAFHKDFSIFKRLIHYRSEDWQDS